MNVKNAIKDLKPYKPNIQNVPTKLDANEGRNYLFPNGLHIQPQFERYPNSNSDALRHKLAQQYNLSKDNFIIGNGSTELLEITVKTYCNPGDVVLSIQPSFSMYKIYATLHGAEFIEVEGDNQPIQSVDSIVQYCRTSNPKIIFLCTPNNPTGSIIQKQDIIKVLQNTTALVIVDEAYMEFCQEDISVSNEIHNFDNLIVARTFSKAYGLAYIRIGYMIANPTIIDQLLSVKLPYSVNGLSTDIAALALERKDEMLRYTKDVIDRRETLYKDLQELGVTVYKSQANFLFINLPENTNQLLLEKGILIRAFTNNNYRVTIGTQKENELFIEALKEILK